MSLELYIKKAKIFMGSTPDGTELHYTAYVNANGTTTRNVPDWVRETATYKHSIKDGSIIDLTPPKPLIIKEAVPDDSEDEDACVEEEAPELVPAGIDVNQPLATGHAVARKVKKG